MFRSRLFITAAALVALAVPSAAMAAGNPHASTEPIYNTNTPARSGVVQPW